MRKKSFLLFVILCCITLLVTCVFVACNPGSGEQTGQPGEGDGGKDETQFFTVTFDTQGGSKIADIKVESGHIVGEFTLPAKQCSRLVGFALDADGEQMWDVLTDKVSADITLYAIWEDAHDWGEWVVTTPATCTEDGEKTRTCNACGETEKEVVPAAHTWGEWETVTDPTCTEEGTQKRVCEVCGKEGTGSIPALGHDFAEEYTVDIAPDCETKGSESRHCTRCDATTDSREIAALGHTWGEWETIIAPTCTEEGTQKRVCEACGEEETGSIPALGHNFTRFEYDDEGHWKICERCNGISEKTPHVYDESGKCECGAIEVTPDSEFTFAKLDDGTYSVTGYTGTRRYVRIPSAHDGAMVTSIGDDAFAYCSGLTSITIPDSVTSIGYQAFCGCSGLTSVTIGNGVTSIGESAFEYCSGLTSIYYTGDMQSWLGKDWHGLIMSSGYTLYINGNKVAGAVVIPDGITSIPSYAFAYQTDITSVTIPNSVTSIGSSAFSGCTGLTSVTIGNGVTSIGNYAFSGCYKLIEVYNKSNLNIVAGSSGNGYVAYYAKNVYTEEGGSRLTIDSGGFVFYYDGATGYLVGHTGNENELVLPDGFVAYNGVWVNAYEINNSAFSDCSGLTSITIPDSVTSIGSSAFSGCTGLTSVTIGNGVESIGDYAFGLCDGLTSIVIPDSVTSIGDYAFYGCSGLTSVTIGNGVTSIGWDAFWDCSGLTSVTIGNGVTSIGWNAFLSCSGLTSIYYTGDMQSWLGKDWHGLIMSSGRTLYINGNKVAGAVVIPDGITSIPPYAFAYQTGITSITIPDSVTSIGDYAFEGCSDLTSVTIGDSVTSIGYRAFYGCSGLTSIVIPDSVTSIGESAFSDCSGLTSVTIGNGVTSIGYRAFYNCSGLTSITIPNGVTSIEAYAFSGCSGLTSITVAKNNAKYHSVENCLIEIATKTLVVGCKTSVIPDDGSVTSIGEGAFRGCSGLTSIAIPDSVTSIGSSAFSGCTGLTSIVIPDSVTIIGDSAFSDCSGLTSITIPDSVTSIGYRAFYNCSGLTSITIGNGVKSIGERAFYNCTELTSITIPDSVTSIGSSAFSDCSGLTSVTFENTSGWQVSSSSDFGSYTDLSSDILSDASIAATYLKFFSTIYWRRV